MSHVDYRRWAHYIHQITKEWYPDCNSILDISCGTGSLLLHLSTKKIIDCIGFDLSFEMIKTANQKIKDNDKHIFFYQGNMLKFHTKKKFDVIVCLYDSINYLQEFDLWRLLFMHVSDVLENNGLFVFDICTERNSLKFFNNYSERGGGFNFKYLRESYYNRITRIHENKYTINFNNDLTDYVEIHKQKIFSLNEVLKFIRLSGFRLIGYFDDFTFKKPDKDSLRIHFVLQNKRDSV